MKDILITGAYVGMGRATALLMRDRGYRVFALDCRTAEPEENIIPIEVDVTSESSVRAAVKKVREYTDSLYGIMQLIM